MQAIASLSLVADQFDALVFDQWGVLHNGQTAYGAAPDVVAALRHNGCRLAVLSNSGKRAEANASRLAAFGFGDGVFETVMTSGEAFWLDVAAGHVPHRAFLPIVANPGDARIWGAGLEVRFADDPELAEAVLLMGLPEGSDGAEARARMQQALTQGLPVYCTNPDISSPRADGMMQLSPGALAREYADQGGKVIYYGKPHLPVFEALRRQLDLPPRRILMIGDSLEHDITGAAKAGWRSVFIQGGLYRKAFAGGATPADLARAANSPSPIT
ncbi:TIGR01459 family HAD-type hydrolase [Rhodophyticola sp. CCM32]|uniref:TIGR01459 family HAD-type hydrolase n=1 Tax=Rhodophyticola sp. CCM32 TaxID=2916397 RepID=UPI00107F1EBB|nr:TIGR01459 family HAD-type hydrolase [Rhodophyticola sp. CCM32]QBY00484.1 TIGR01459 family HAD-type hydrolase [Rhodophyticola sp. CCM32]